MAKNNRLYFLVASALSLLMIFALLGLRLDEQSGKRTKISCTATILDVDPSEVEGSDDWVLHLDATAEEIQKVLQVCLGYPDLLKAE